MNREATPEEVRWWKRFRATLKAMPKSMEVIVGGYGSATAAPRGAVKAAMDAPGSEVGRAETLPLPSIDGRTSGLADGTGGV
jgi:hypothetical protein